MLTCQTVSSGLRLTDTYDGLRVIAGSAARRLRLRWRRVAQASAIVSIIRHGKLGEFPMLIQSTEYSKAKGRNALGKLDVLVDLLLSRLCTG